MENLQSIRIKNLRAIKDTTDIEIKPITVLLGRNSSGKSSFIRTFPLLKQTLQQRMLEPILWYGQYVDFGDFNESLNKNNNNNGIGFSFDFYISTIEVIRPFNFSRHYSELKEWPNKERVHLEIVCLKEYIESFMLKFGEQQIIMEFSSRDNLSKLQINDKKIDVKNIRAIYAKNLSSGLIPNLFVLKDSRYLESIEQVFKEKLQQELLNLAHKATKEKSIYPLVNNPIVGSPSLLLKMLKNKKAIPRSLSDKMQNFTSESIEFLEINNLLVGRYINEIISECNKQLISYYSSVKYIAPLRASAERYYRVQGIATDDIDARGENIPMYIHNMGATKRQRFNEWMAENFGFTVDTIIKGGHISLNITDQKTRETVNMADTGFGYSQILPIIVILYQSREESFQATNLNRVRYGIINDFLRTITIAIEQPELHLHPSMQDKLIDTFVSVIKYSQQKKLDIKIIFETHSERIINRLGYHIAKKNFSNELINILLFNKTENSSTNITCTGYNEKGIIKDWPLGFFS